MLSRRGRSLLANASGVDTHCDSISSRFDCSLKPPPKDLSGWEATTLDKMEKPYNRSNLLSTKRVLLQVRRHPQPVSAAFPDVLRAAIMPRQLQPPRARSCLVGGDENGSAQRARWNCCVAVLVPQGAAMAVLGRVAWLCAPSAMPGRRLTSSLCWAGMYLWKVLAYPVLQKQAALCLMGSADSFFDGEKARLAALD
eukprot:COSAG01_NODE_554_length_15534_cov_101.167541_12_plen_197_part_00